MARDVRIVEIHNNPPGPDEPSKLNQEYLVIESKGTTTEDIVAWTLIDQTPTGEQRHSYEFPATLGNGSRYSFEPGELVYVMTGSGVDIFKPAHSLNDPEPRPHFDFYQNRKWFIWNNTGDTAHLYDGSGREVARLTVP